MFPRPLPLNYIKHLSLTSSDHAPLLIQFDTPPLLYLKPFILILITMICPYS